jgi:RHS repeat-associated protein
VTATPGSYASKWDFGYDGDGNRVSTLLTTYANGQVQSTELTVYYTSTGLSAGFGGAYETQSDGTIRKYYSFAGQTIAVFNLTPDTGTPDTLSYFLTDHLGSIVAITDSSGTLTSQQRYLPFGQVRADITGPQLPITDLGYTGQRNLGGDLGLMDYRARFYSSALGRFTQPDMLIPNAGNPQSWNRYSYVLNRPINMNDPSGHCAPFCIIIPVLVVTAIFLTGDTPQPPEPVRFYYLNNGGVIDKEHFDAGLGHWLKVEDAFTNKKRSVILPMPGKEDGRFSLENISSLDDPNLVTRYLEFQQKYEEFQFTIQEPASGFSPEDIPSDLLGFLAGKEDLSIEDVVQILGGTSSTGGDYSLGNPAIKNMINPNRKNCLIEGCGLSDFQNSSPKMKVPDGYKKFKLLDYPKPFDILNRY